MNVERLVQKIKLGERYLIQDSMRKAINLISENRKTQEDIIKHLPEKEITKIMTYLEDSDPSFRKLTAKFLLELLYGNYSVQQLFCNCLGILPLDGKVCINQIPEAIKRASIPFSGYLEILKKTFPEEVKESSPYCWYLTPDSLDLPENQMKFIAGNEKKGIEDLDTFFDPLYTMFGFIVKAPKTKKTVERSPECVEKNIIFKENERKRAPTSFPHSRFISSVNSSLDQSINSRFLNDSKSPERDLFKSVSPVRSLVSNSISVPKVSYIKKLKTKGGDSRSTSICNSERYGKTKNAIEVNDEHQLMNRGAEYGLEFKRYSAEQSKIINQSANIKNKVSPIRESNLSLDIYENFHHSKLAASIDESRDCGSKVLETSFLNSISHKGSIHICTNEKSPDVSQQKLSLHDKKIEALKKVSDDKSKITSLKSKPLDLERKFVPKSSRDSNSFSFSAASTPKNNLLNKILKEKKIVKETLSSSKQTKTKQELTKKFNPTTTVSSTFTTKGVSQKYSFGGHKTQGFSKIESEYSNKKNAFHSSLLKSVDLSDPSSTVLYMEERGDMGKENVQHDSSEKTHYEKLLLKNKPYSPYNIQPVLKSSISISPRSPVDNNMKASLGQSSKFVNTRKSPDASYLSNFYRDKRNSEASVSYHNLKNGLLEKKDIQIDNRIRDSITEFSPDHNNRSITPQIYMK